MLFTFSTFDTETVVLVWPLRWLAGLVEVAVPEVGAPLKTAAVLAVVTEQSAVWQSSARKAPQAPAWHITRHRGVTSRTKAWK